MGVSYSSHHVLVRAGACLLALLAVLLVAAGARAAGRTLRAVTYHGFTVRIPSSWPVFRLSGSRTCVRFNRHALYLGVPAAQQECPAGSVGRSEAILLEPLARGARPAAAALGTGSTSFVVKPAGVLVTATWRRELRLIERALRRHRLPRPPHLRPIGQISPHLAVAADSYEGPGFDACAAPSSQAMQAWAASSPYRAVGIYIGGTNAACPAGSAANPNLTASWIGQQLAAGWRLIPAYVGLQPPNSLCDCVRMSSNPSRASSQGAIAAEDAVADMGSLNLPAGSPVYLDIEHYHRSSTNTSAVLAFGSAWTAQLHASGYISGIYGTSSSTIADLASRWGTGYPEPDDIWFAEWNGQPTASSSYIPESYWSDRQRLHQYSGAQDETHGGATVNVDDDYIGGATAGLSLPAPPLGPEPIAPAGLPRSRSARPGLH
ncbi:MAG TPA: DUF1906 domain-containing protein [Thermoleophilaceae bacterium]|nr:DUF1906 domain-containing protein [Thermoleophilaceae bacterium]